VAWEHPFFSYHPILIIAKFTGLLRKKSKFRLPHSSSEAAAERLLSFCGIGGNRGNISGLIQKISNYVKISAENGGKSAKGRKAGEKTPPFYKMTKKWRGLSKTTNVLPFRLYEISTAPGNISGLIQKINDYVKISAKNGGKSAIGKNSEKRRKNSSKVRSEDTT